MFFVTFLLFSSFLCFIVFLTETCQRLLSSVKGGRERSNARASTQIGGASGWSRRTHTEARGGWSSLRAAVVPFVLCRDAVTCEHLLFSATCVMWMIWWWRSSMTQDAVYFWSKLCSVTLTSHTGQLVYCGTEAEWTIGSCKPISETLEGTIFSSCGGERSWSLDAHFRHIVHDWKVTLTMTARHTFTWLLEAARLWCQRCSRLLELSHFHSTAIQNSSKWLDWFCVGADCWIVASLVPVTVAIRVLFTTECVRQKSGHMDKPSLKRSCQYPRVQDETVSRLGSEVVRWISFRPAFLWWRKSPACGSRHNIVFVLSYGRPDVKLCHWGDWSRRAVAVMMFTSWHILFQDVREAFEPCAAHEASRFQWRGTNFVITQLAVCAVTIKATDRAYDGIAAFLSHTRRKTRSSNRGAPTQEPSKQRVSQTGETWRGTASAKLVLTKSYVALELIMRVSRSISAERRCGDFMVVKTEVVKHNCWSLSREFSLLVVCFQPECSAWTCTLVTDSDLESWRALRDWLKKKSCPVLPSIHNSDDRVIHTRNKKMKFNSVTFN